MLFISSTLLERSHQHSYSLVLFFFPSVHRHDTCLNKMIDVNYKLSHSLAGCVVFMFWSLSSKNIATFLSQHTSMANNGDEPPLFSGKFGVILIAMGSASSVVTMYRLIVICFQNSAEQARRRGQPAHAPTSEEGGLVSHQIPSHKYEKKKKKNGVQNCDDDDDDVTCAVCLGDFEEGEELRTMPSCMHSFHVACIDTWLLSHSNCPVCRANATPLPVIPHCLSEVGFGVVNAEHSIDMVQIAHLQNGLPVVPS